jgi:SAM-dependent methyltransferase
MTDKKTISIYDEQVEQYASTIKQEASDQIILDFIAKFDQGDLILDLGCGPAQSSAIMRDKGLRVDPTDASSEMVKLANATYDISARQATFNEINTTNTYQGIWANFSLLHASADDFPKILEKLHQALKPNGIFHIGMKLGNGSQRDKLGRLYTYYSQKELCNLLVDAQFTVLDIKLGEALGLAGDVEPWIVVTSTAD